MPCARAFALSVFALAVLTGSLSLQIGTGAPTLIAENTTTTEMPVLQNGGFEQGLAGWGEVHGEGGSYGISSSIVHSGSSALVLGLRPSRPGGTPSGTVEGVSQNVSVSLLRELRLDAWYETAINTNDAAVRLAIQVGKLAVRYYVFYGPQISSASVGDTQTSKSIFLGNSLCSEWCSTGIDVTADFQRLFGTNDYRQVFLSEVPVPVVVSLELIVYLTTSPQYIFWDDVNATAQILSFQEKTTRSTSTLNLTIQISSAEAFSSSSATSTHTTGSATTASGKTMGQSAPGLSLNLSGLLLPGALVMLIVTLTIDLVKRFGPKRIRQASTKSDRNGIQCPECGRSSPTGSNFCDACGTRFQKL